MNPAPEEPARQTPVAIVGMAVMLPGASDLATYWSNLTAGVDAIRPVPPSRWDPEFYTPDAAHRPVAPDEVYCHRGGFIDDLAEIDPHRCGVMPGAVPDTEPDQLIALEVAVQALADAGGEDVLSDRSRVGVILGRGSYLTPGLVRLDQRVRTAHQLASTLRELVPDLDDEQLRQVREAFTSALGPHRPESAVGLVPNLAAARLASLLDVHGPAYTVDAACASSLVAVDQAVSELASGRCDVVVAGGVHHAHDVTVWSMFSQLHVLSHSEQARPFDERADGMLIGEGTGVVVLKRLADAERDGNRVYAVIRGTGVASGGRVPGLLTPDPRGQELALRRAWEAAGLDPAQPRSVGLIEGHGAGTPAADLAELVALNKVFGTPTAADGEDTEAAAADWAVLGSVKSMIGHTMAAAGVAGLVKAALAIHHGVLPPTLHCEKPLPQLEGGRFRVLEQAVPWEQGDPDAPRRAGVNAFGFGGINAHVVLEEAPAHTRARRARAHVAEPDLMLRFATRTYDELVSVLEADDAELREKFTGEPEYRGPGYRLALVAPTARRMTIMRRIAIGSRYEGSAWRGRNDVWLSSEPLLAPPAPGKIAFVFPGLEPEFTPKIDDVAAHFGLPLLETNADDIARHGLSVLQVGRLLDRALRGMGVEPDTVAGHSIGEWTATVVAGMFDNDEVDQTIARYDPSELQVPGVDFAVLSTGVDEVREAIAGHPEIVLSHDNAPHQAIVCGPSEAIAELVKAFRRRNILAQIMPFQSGFHTPWLEPYLDGIRKGVEHLRKLEPQVPVWSATTVSHYPDDEEAVRELYVRHLLEPVRFRELTRAMYDDGVRVFVQVGTGRLAGLIDDTLGEDAHLTIAANSPLTTGMDQLRRVAVALWVEGGNPDFSALLPERSAALAAAPAAPVEPLPRAGRPVRLTLGSGLVSLPEQVRATLVVPVAARSAGTAGAAAEAAAPAPVEARPQRALGAWAAKNAVAAQLDALLTETEDAAVTLLETASRQGRLNGGGADARRRRGPDATSETAPPAPTRRPDAPSDPAAHADEPSADVASTDAPSTDDTSATGSGLPFPIRIAKQVRVNVDELPFLIDHCFFEQRPGWPDISDRRPVVPATTMIQWMMDLAEESAPGRRAVAIREVRLNKWLIAGPDVEVPLAVLPRTETEVEVRVGTNVQAIVELAEDYPAPVFPWPPGFNEREPVISARDLYDLRWLFHGPQFQGITKLDALGDLHARGVITSQEAPGALLDNGGQLLGYWNRSVQKDRLVIFPVYVDEIRFYGPQPAVGTPVDCHVVVTTNEASTVEADIQFSAYGTVWAEIRGWRDRRFDSNREDDEAYRFPERLALARPQPGGFSLLIDRWPDLASRDLYCGKYLGGTEHDAYAASSPRERRQWLLGRMAVKDAIRQQLWAEGRGPIFPAEIRIDGEAEVAVTASGVHGLEMPEMAISLAACREAGVALAVPRSADGPGVGIDIQEIRDEADAAVLATLSDAEKALLDRLATDEAAATGAAAARVQSAWTARFAAARLAAAKAERTGLGSRPERLRVADTTADALVVEVAADNGVHRHTVYHAQVSNLPGAPERDYAVAWSWGAGPDGPVPAEPHRSATTPNGTQR